MKKIIVSLFTIAAAFGFGGCAQSDVDDNSGFVSGNAKPLKIVGTTTAAVTLESDGDDTRATVEPGDNGKYKAKFGDDDVLRVFEMYQNEGAWFCQEVNSTAVSNSSTTVTRNVYEKTPQRYDYLLFYPASALTEEQNDSNDVIKSYGNGNTPTVKLTVPTVQHPTADAPDTEATILFAKALNVNTPDNNGENTLDHQLQQNKFRPLTAYGKMTLKDLDNDKKVKNVKVTILGYRFPNGNSTTSHITGTYNSYQFNNEYNTNEASSVYYDPNATTGYNYVELDYEKNPLTPNNGEAVVWFSIVSNMYLAGQDGVDKSASSFIVKVTYEDNTVVEKQFNTKGKTGTDGKPTFKFTNGYVTSFSASMKQNAGGGAEPDYPTEFKKVTSVEEGKKYIFVINHNGQQYVLRNDGNYTDSNPNETTVGNFAVKVTALNSSGFTLNDDKLTTTTTASYYTFLVDNKEVAKDNYCFNDYKFYSTTTPTAWLRVYNNTNVILSTVVNEGAKYFGLNVGNDGTSLYYSAGSSANYLTNNYIYTDGNIAKATTDAQNVITIYGVDTGTNSGPDMTEPLLEEKLTIANGTANQYHSGSGIENLWDGVANSDADSDIYHSPYNTDYNGLGGTGTDFNNGVILTFNLKKTSDVYRMHYYTRLSTGSNGLPGECDILYQTSDDTWHNAKEGKGGKGNAMYNFNMERGTKDGSGDYKGGYYHEVDFSAAPLMGVKAVQLKFYSGRENFLTGTEVVFYGAEATPENQLTILFARANQAHNSNGTNSKVQNLIDGQIQTTVSAENDNAIYHSPWGSETWLDANMNTQTGTVFPVELCFDTAKSDVVRLDYYTRLTNNGNPGNGTPGKFDVLYRCEGDPKDKYRPLNSKYDESKPNAERLADAQFDMGKTEHRPFTLRFPTVLRNVIEIKMVFYEGSTVETTGNGKNGYLSGVEVRLFGETK